MAESRGGGVGRPAAWPSEVVAASRAVNLQISGAHEMMKARTSLWASLAIAASVGLAGCGGSNDNDETSVVEPSGPTAEEQIAAAQAAEAAAKAAEQAAKDELAAAEQAAARKDARDLANDIQGKVLATIDRKRTLTSATVGANYTQLDGSTSIDATEMTRAQGRDTASATGRTSEDNPIIPALKKDKDDKAMYSGTLGTDTFTARVYTTAMDKIGQSFATNLPGTAIANFPGQTTLGYYQGGRFTFDVATAGRQDLSSAPDDSNGATHASIEADDFPTSSGVKQYEVDERIFKGKLGGIDGTYACTVTSTATSCSATLVDGAVSFSGGLWTFAPDDETAGITVADTKYLSFGW